jgi:hypothetical protein
LLSAAGGWGVAHDNKTGRDIYMKMVSGGVGIGLGVKDFRGVFVFTTQEAFKKFTESGWEANVQADAAAKSGQKGGSASGAITVAPGMELYQLTEHGLALQATIQGTKYYRDEERRGRIGSTGRRVIAREGLTREASEFVKKCLSLLLILEDAQHSIPMQFEQPLRFGDLQPQGRISICYNYHVGLRILASEFQSFLLPEFENLIRQSLAKAHVEDIVDVARFHDGENCEYGIQR